MTRSLFRTALYGSLAGFVGNALQRATGLLAAIIIFSFVSPYEYGLWQLLLSVSVAFGVVGFPGIGGMLIADVSREIGSGRRNEAASILVRAAPSFIGLGAFGALLMALSAPFVGAVSGIGFVPLIVALSLGVFATGIRIVYQLVLQGTLSLVHAQGMKAAERAGYLAGIILCIPVLHLGVAGIVYAYVISLFVGLVCYAPIVLRKYLDAVSDADTRDRQPFLDAVFRRGRWSIASDVVTAAAGALWPWLLGYFLGIEEVGYASMALLLLAQISSLVPIGYVLRSLLPRVAESDVQMAEWLTRSIKYSVWAHITAGLVVFLVASALVPLWFPAYVPVLPLLAVLMLSLPLRAAAVPAAEWFFASRSQRDLFLVSALPKALLVLLLPPFLLTLHLAGYALWYLLTSDLLLFLRLRLILMRAGIRIDWRSFLAPDARDEEILGRVIADIRGRLRAR